MICIEKEEGELLFPNTIGVYGDNPSVVLVSDNWHYEEGELLFPNKASEEHEEYEEYDDSEDKIQKIRL